jgi:hypothetical protein
LGWGSEQGLGFVSSTKRPSVLLDRHVRVDSRHPLAVCKRPGFSRASCTSLACAITDADADAAASASVLGFVPPSHARGVRLPTQLYIYPLYIYIYTLYVLAIFSYLYSILLHSSIVYIILYLLYLLWDPLVTLSKYIYV